MLTGKCCGFESHPRQLRKSDCLGCAVLLCLVCLFDLACFFLPSLIFKNVYVCIHSNCVHILMRDEKEQHVQLYNVQCTCICTVHLIQEYGMQKISPQGRVVGGQLITSNTDKL